MLRLFPDELSNVEQNGFHKNGSIIVGINLIVEYLNKKGLIAQYVAGGKMTELDHSIISGGGLWVQRGGTRTRLTRAYDSCLLRNSQHGELL